MPNTTRVNEQPAKRSGAEGNNGNDEPGPDNLAETEPGLLKEDERLAAWRMVYMPSTNSGYAITRYNDFESAALKILGFADALIDTARNWGETELMSIPGYRDRIVHIRLDEDEGGLNLDMPEQVIRNLALRGELAAEMLIARFGSHEKTDPNPLVSRPIRLNWENHQWIRYRAVTAALEAFLKDFRDQWAKPGTDYADLISRDPNGLPSYRWNKGQQAHAEELTQGLLTLVDSWTEPNQAFDLPKAKSGPRSPRPKPSIRLLPSGKSESG